MFVTRVWIEAVPYIDFDPETDSADVLVEMEDGRLAGPFRDLAHLRREMDMSLNVARDYNRMLAPTSFLTMETPHVIVENLHQDTIEDGSISLVVLGIFEARFRCVWRIVCCSYGARRSDAETVPDTATEDTAGRR